MALRWDGNQRQAKMLSARFWCIFCFCVLPLLPERAHSPELLFSRSGSRLLRFRKHEKNPFQQSLAGNSCVIHMAA